MDFRLGALALTVVPISSVVNYFYGQILSQNAAKVQETLGKSNAIVHETLANIRTVRSFPNERLERKRFGRAVEEWYVESYRAAKLRGVLHVHVFAHIRVPRAGEHSVSRRRVRAGRRNARGKVNCEHAV